MTAEAPKMYGELAPWWHLLSVVEDYLTEAMFFHELLDRVGHVAPPHTLLELGSGGGNNAWHLKAYYQLTLVDLSAGMLAASRTLNPECEHIEGDMRTLRLGRLFDAVFIHDAICYMTTEADLRRALETAFVHCRAGGAAVFVPDDVRETFKTQTEHGGHDGEDRGIRYMEWSYDPDETDTVSTADYVYMLREGADTMRVIHDRHICGLFGWSDWMRLLAEVGFASQVEMDSYGRNVFIGVKPH